MPHSNAKKHDQMYDPKCRNLDFYEEMAIEKFSTIVLQKREGPR